MISKTKWILSLILFLFAIRTDAQEPLPFLQKDSFTLHWENYYSIDTLSFIHKNASSPSQAAWAALHLARHYYDQHQATKILPLLREAEVYQTETKDTVLAVKVYRMYGLFYRMVDQPEKAVSYMLNNLRLAEVLGDQRELTAACNNLAAVFVSLKNYETAMVYHRKALQLAKRRNDSLQQEIILGNMVPIFIAQEQYDSAQLVAQAAIHYAEQIADSLGVLYTSLELIRIHLQKKDFAKAQTYVELGEQWMPFDQPLSQVKLYELQSDLAKAQGDYPLAIARAQAAEALLPEGAFLQYHYNTKNRLYELYNIEGVPARALKYLEELQQIQDSLYNIEKRKKIENLQTAYEVERKEATIKQLAQENQIKGLQLKQNFYVTLGLILLALLLGTGYYLFSQQQLLKNKQRQLEIEQQLQRARLNPHFIFNALNAIREVIHTKDRTEAEAYLIRFSRMMRSLLEFTAAEFITIEEELEFMLNYLQLQRLRFSGEFSFSIDSAGANENFLVPAMITQPVVENAIEHGMIKGPEAQLNVSVKTEKNSCQITISNKLDLAPSSSIKHRQSFGLDITRRRLHFLSHQTGQNFKLSGPLEDEGRMVVEIHLGKIEDL